MSSTMNTSEKSAFAESPSRRGRGERRNPPGPDGRPLRGRPPAMSREETLAMVRATAEKGGLFRVHFEQPALYARARRLWGSWAGALLAAGVDYDGVMMQARLKSAESRRRTAEARRRNRRATAAR